MTTFSDILRQQAQLYGQQQATGAQQGQTMQQGAQIGGKMLANALRAKPAAATAPTGFQLGQPLVAGQAGNASIAGSGAAGALPVAAAGLVALNADRIGNEVGRFGDKLGLEKTGLPDQARAFGNFVKGDFGGAWGNLKDSVKNIFKVF